MSSLTSLFRTEVAVALAVGYVLALLLYALRPHERRGLSGALAVLVLCTAAEAIDLVAARHGGHAAAALLADGATVLLGLVLVRLGGRLLFRVLLPAAGVRLARIVEDLATTAGMLAWGLVWLRFAGVDLASLVTTSAIVTAVIAFSMQETLGNILGGVVLQLDRSLRVGDWVRIDDLGGRVAEIRWRHTAVETRNRETVMIPNGWLMKNRFTVIGSREDDAPRWRRWVHFDIELECPPQRACDALLAAVADASIPHVAREPRPTAVLLSATHGYGRYALRYHLDDPELDDTTDSAVRIHVLASLARAGIRVAVPREERLMIKDNETRRAAEHQREMARRRAALARVDLFAPLSDAERAAIAEHLVYAPFARGDTVTREGAIAHWLYLIVGGEADVWVDTPTGRTHVSTLAAGRVFGEMGLMTGEPRRATVTARTDLECYRLDKAGFAQVLGSRPDVASEISRVLAARDAELAAARERAGAAATRATGHEDLLARIRAFFGLGS